MLMRATVPRGNEDEPWLNEPDRVAWYDAKTGFQCLILRTRMGNLCGYVRVPRDHVLHGKQYGQRGIERYLRVHGGITFSGCLGGRRMKRGHWFGFDCAHWGDLVPKMMLLSFYALNEPLVYRDIAYVRAECESLAAQLAKRKG